MKTLLHPTYFPNIATFTALVQNDVCWEVEDNYQKQTYRNRCYICTDRGRLMLNIPVQHVGGAQGRQKYKEVKVDNAYRWQRQHWRTLETAYRTSPFFEFYEDEIAPLFTKEYRFLLDWNFKTIEIICNCLQIDMPLEKTEIYQKNIQTVDHKPQTFQDIRFLVNAKKELTLNQNKYVQVFNDRHGFIKNTSILDLLFNEGTNTKAYLRQQNSDYLNA